MPSLNINYIKILGCGSSQGVPKIDGSWGQCKKNSKNNRTRCSIYIKVNDLNFIIDTSPDLRQQFIKNKIRNIDFALFTHAHADHILGINELRTFFIKNKKKVDVYSTDKTQKTLKKIFKYLFINQKNYPAILKGRIIKDRIKIKNKVNIKIVNVTHGDMPTVGYRINNFAYIPDFKVIEKNEIKKLKNLDVLIIDCFRFEPHYSHVNFEESMEYIKKINPKKTFLTNLNHNVDYHQILKKINTSSIRPCYDGLKIKIK